MNSKLIAPEQDDTTPRSGRFGRDTKPPEIDGHLRLVNRMVHLAENLLLASGNHDTNRRDATRTTRMPSPQGILLVRDAKMSRRPVEAPKGQLARLHGAAAVVLGRSHRPLQDGAVVPRPAPRLRGGVVDGGAGAADALSHGLELFLVAERVGPVDDGVFLFPPPAVLLSELGIEAVDECNELNVEAVLEQNELVGCGSVGMRSAGGNDEDVLESAWQLYECRVRHEDYHVVQQRSGDGLVAHLRGDWRSLVLNGKC